MNIVFIFVSLSLESKWEKEVADRLSGVQSPDRFVSRFSMDKKQQFAYRDRSLCIPRLTVFRSTSIGAAPAKFCLPDQPC
jgi:hypothetical protein